MSEDSEPAARANLAASSSATAKSGFHFASPALPHGGVRATGTGVEGETQLSLPEKETGEVERAPPAWPAVVGSLLRKKPGNPLYTRGM